MRIVDCRLSIAACGSSIAAQARSPTSRSADRRFESCHCYYRSFVRKERGRVRCADHPVQRFVSERSAERTLPGFWMAAMTPLKRVTGNQYLHRKSDAYRNAVRRKISAYHRHIQLGLIAQGLLQTLSATASKSVWHCYGSWIRTIRPGLAPSEQVAAIALQNTLPGFLAGATKTSILVKFLRHRIDLSRSEGTRLVALHRAHETRYSQVTRAVTATDSSVLSIEPTDTHRGTIGEAARMRPER